MKDKNDFHPKQKEKLIERFGQDLHNQLLLPTFQERLQTN
jgi:hypothetical protein